MASPYTHFDLQSQFRQCPLSENKLNETDRSSTSSETEQPFQQNLVNPAGMCIPADRRTRTRCKENHFLSRTLTKLSSSMRRCSIDGVSKTMADQPKPSNFMTLLQSNTLWLEKLLAEEGSQFSPLKLKVILKALSLKTSSFLKIAPSRKVVTMYDPPDYHRNTGQLGETPRARVFAFDHIAIPEDPMASVSFESLSGILQAVLSGDDGCIFSLGLTKSGHMDTMFGLGDVPDSLGIIPLAVAGLLYLINNKQQNGQSKFSVFMSAFEVSGTHNEVQRDLLASGSSRSTKPTEVCLHNTEDAEHFLEIISSCKTSQEGSKTSLNLHTVVSLSLYQSCKETNVSQLPAVTGIYSRLRLIAFGGGSSSSASGRCKSDQIPGFSGLISVIKAVLMGQRNLPFKDNILTKIILESMGSESCHICVIAHICTSQNSYHDILQLIHNSAQMPELCKRAKGFCTPCSSKSSALTPGSHRQRRTIQMGTGRLVQVARSICSDPEILPSRSPFSPFNSPVLQKEKRLNMKCSSKVSHQTTGKGLWHKSCSTDNVQSHRPFQQPNCAHPSSTGIPSVHQKPLSKSNAIETDNLSLRHLFPVQEQWVDGPPGFQLEQIHLAECQEHKDTSNVRSTKHNPSAQKPTLIPSRRSVRVQSGSQSDSCHNYQNKAHSAVNKQKPSASVRGVCFRGNSAVSEKTSLKVTALPKSVDAQSSSLHLASTILETDVPYNGNSAIIKRDNVCMSDSKMTPSHSDLNPSNQESLYETIMEGNLEIQTEKYFHNSLAETLNVPVSERPPSKPANKSLGTSDFEAKCEASGNNSASEHRRVIKKSSMINFPRLGSKAITNSQLVFHGWTDGPLAAMKGCESRDTLIKSPYSAITRPQLSKTASSGIGSEPSASVRSYRLRTPSKSKSEAGYSSGYESTTHNTRRLAAHKHHSSERSKNITLCNSSFSSNSTKPSSVATENSWSPRMKTGEQFGPHSALTHTACMANQLTTSTRDQRAKYSANPIQNLTTSDMYEKLKSRTPDSSERREKQGHSKKLRCSINCFDSSQY